MAAVLEPAGSGVAGVQPKGITQQYQLSATAANKDTSTDITPYDSGTILGTVPPGKAGIKLVSGVIQRSTQIKADATPGVVGNALISTVNLGTPAVYGLPPVPPTGSAAANGLSQAPEHE
jgi:hypothetical protein